MLNKHGKKIIRTVFFSVFGICILLCFTVMASAGSIIYKNEPEATPKPVPTAAPTVAPTAAPTPEPPGPAPTEAPPAVTPAPTSAPNRGSGGGSSAGSGGTASGVIGGAAGNTAALAPPAGSGTQSDPYKVDDPAKLNNAIQDTTQAEIYIQLDHHSTNGCQIYLANDTTVPDTGMEIKTNRTVHMVTGCATCSEYSIHAAPGKRHFRLQAGVKLLLEETAGRPQIVLQGPPGDGIGGGIIVNGSNAAVSGGILRSCYALGGGGIFVSSDLTGISLSDIYFDRCKAKSTLELINASGSGGGLFINENSTATVSGCTFVACSAINAVDSGLVHGAGGGAMTCSGSNVTFAECVFRQNTARVGGAVYTHGKDGNATALLRGCIIEDNTAEHEGGGLAAAHEFIISIEKGLTLAGNDAGDFGGGILLLRNESADARLLLKSGTVNIKGNTTGGIGGGIYLKAVDMQIKRSVTLNVAGNESGGYGAGVNAASGSIIQSEGIVTITDNHSTGEQTYDGTTGGLYLGASRAVFNGPVTEKGNPYFYNNTTVLKQNGLGAGMSLEADATAVFSANPVFQDNVSSGRGGGIFISDSTVVVEQGTALSITGTPGIDNAYSGGGMYLSNAIISNEGTISIADNEARRSAGGGIAVAASTVNRIEGGGKLQLIRNETGMALTANRGGGIHIDDSATLNLLGRQDITVTGNKSLNGGGISVGTGALIQSSTTSAVTLTVSENNAVTSSADGGGLHLRSGAKLQFYNDTLKVDTNTAARNGGGIYMEPGAGMHLGGDDTQNTVTGNTAAKGGGIYLSGNNTIEAANLSTLPGSQVDITGNTASEGGGIYAAGSGNALIARSQGRFYIRNHTSSVIARGGGIYTAGGLRLDNQVTVAAVVPGIQITGNGNGRVYGGGAYVAQGGVLHIERDDGTGAGLTWVDNNTALYGGGLYLEGGTANQAGGIASIYNTRLSSNEAEYGGGVFIAYQHMDQSGDMVTANGGLAANGSKIENNSAAMDGGGAYIQLSSETDFGNAATYSANHESNAMRYATLSLLNGSTLSGNTARAYSEWALDSPESSFQAMAAHIHQQGSMETTQFSTADGGAVLENAYNNLDINHQPLSQWHVATAKVKKLFTGVAPAGQDFWFTLGSGDTAGDIKYWAKVADLDEQTSFWYRNSTDRYDTLPYKDAGTYWFAEANENSGVLESIVFTVNGQVRTLTPKQDGENTIYTFEISQSDFPLTEMTFTVTNSAGFHTNELHIIKEVQGAPRPEEVFTVELEGPVGNGETYTATAIGPNSFSFTNSAQTLPEYLPFGQYTIKELEGTSDLYRLDSISLNGTALTADSNGAYSFTIGPETQSLNFAVTNQSLYTLRLRKVNAADITKSLSGAEFSLYMCEGTCGGNHPIAPGEINTCWAHFTDAEATPATGLIDLGTVPPGTYALVETKAPAGYNLPAGYWVFLIEADGTMTQPAGIGHPAGIADLGGAYADEVQYLVTNVPTMALPKTGGGLYMGIAGITAVGLAGYLVIRRKKSGRPHQ